MEQLEKNKLINKFMGHESTNVPSYETSYDLLMPVVNKCIKIYHDRRFDIFDALTKAKEIDVLYDAVIKFIEWYYDVDQEWCVCIGYPAPEHKIILT